MANSKLLKEAIADAKAVRETAIANAKLALEEAFTPRLQSILSKKIQAEMEEEDDEVMGEEDEMEVDDVVDVESMHADVDVAEESDDEFDTMSEEDEELDIDLEEDEVTGVGYDDPTNADDASLEEEDDMELDEDEMDLEEIIRELESELDSEDEMHEEDEMHDEDEFDTMSEEDEELDIELVDEDEMEIEDEMEADAEMEIEEEDEFSDEIDLDEILREMGYGDDEEEVHTEEEVEDDVVDNTAELESELEEAYSTIKSLRKTINEVNLLNAKLLYTNKLFRSYNLTNEQKVKVVENLDRTGSVREVKLVYATLAESMNFSGTERKGKKNITEGLASKTVKSTAPKKEIISEGNQMADRFKQLAGLINK